MSLFNNTSLINDLLKIGAKDLLKFSQSNSPEVYELANKMLIDLQREIDPKSAPPKTSPLTSEKPVNLSSTNLVNLGDFITWAADNKLLWNNKRFAWKEKEQMPSDVWQFSGYTFNRDRNPNNRQPDSVTLYASKPELLSVLKYLRDSKENNDNKVMQVMIGRSIDEINEKLSPKEKISSKPQESAKMDLDPNAVVDGIHNYLDEDNPLTYIDGWRTNFRDANNKITVAILNDLSRFKLFINNLIVKSKQDPVGHLVSGEYSDPCLAIRILHKRASHLVYNVGESNDEKVPNYSKMTKLYLKKIEEISSTFRDKSGKPCSIETATSTTTPSSPSSTEPGKEGLTAVKLQQLSSLINDNLPLKFENIDVSRITYFITKYNEFETSIRKNDIVSLTTQLFSINGQIVNFTGNRSNLIVDLKDHTIDMLLSLIKINENKIAIRQFIVLLTNLVATTIEVVNMLDSTYGKYLSSNLQSLLNQQKTIARQNIEDLKRYDGMIKIK
jgi:hypothetical protein